MRFVPVRVRAQVQAAGDQAVQERQDGERADEVEVGEPQHGFQKAGGLRVLRAAALAGSALKLLHPHQSKHRPRAEHGHAPQPRDQHADTPPGDQQARAEREADGQVSLRPQSRHVQDRRERAAFAHKHRQLAHGVAQQPRTKPPQL